MFTSKLVIFLVASCFVSQIYGYRRQSNCFNNIPWHELLKDLYKMDKDIRTCAYSTSLVNCEPKTMLHKVRYNSAAISQILYEIIKMFQEKDAPFPQMKSFLINVHEARVKLIKSAHFQQSEVHEEVHECFKNMNLFLEEKINDYCAWEKVLFICGEIIQRIENCA